MFLCISNSNKMPIHKGWIHSHILSTKTLNNEILFTRLLLTIYYHMGMCQTLIRMMGTKECYISRLWCNYNTLFCRELPFALIVKRN